MERRPSGAGLATLLGAGRKLSVHLSDGGPLARSVVVRLVSRGQVTGARASGPSSRRMCKQRRASVRAIVIDARVCESPRALSARESAWSGLAGLQADWAAS